jgi:hypothetical protein
MGQLLVADEAGKVWWRANSEEAAEKAARRLAFIHKRVMYVMEARSAYYPAAYLAARSEQGE